jgi:hypothetical protein
LGVFKKFEYEKLQSKKKRESILKKKEFSTPTKFHFKHEESSENLLKVEEEDVKDVPPMQPKSNDPLKVEKDVPLIQPKTESKVEEVNTQENDSSDEKEMKDWRREIWELKMWNYSIFTKNFFCFFSPFHVLFMMVLSFLYNHVVIILLLIIMYSNSILVIPNIFNFKMHFLVTKFEQKEIDQSLINKEVYHVQMEFNDLRVTSMKKAIKEVLCSEE